MSNWHARLVPFKFQLSDLTLASVSLPIQARAVQLVEDLPPVALPALPPGPLEQGSQGYLVRGLPVLAELPVVSHVDNYICYVPLQYQHCYIDLRTSFETYQKKFSSKTRSTIARKLRKYAAHCGGEIRWRAFTRPEELTEFFRLARIVSKTTYQEKLLDAGIPETDEFKRQASNLAGQDHLRAYILFDGDRPVSYLYCPVEGDVLIYAYLGYDPDYMSMSVGTVLQWLAIEQLFGESRFRYFDFTEGQSEHKRLFATHQRRCANVFLLRRTVRNSMLVHCHHAMNGFSNWLGELLERLGIKARIRRLLRFGS